jgi:hypothetical protein
VQEVKGVYFAMKRLYYFDSSGCAFRKTSYIWEVKGIGYEDERASQGDHTAVGQ